MWQHHIPSAAVNRCERWVKDLQVQVRVARSRKSKLGDFRPDASGATTGRITVNGDLPPPLFLITLVHELAHAKVYRTCQSLKHPHGQRWKRVFQQMMEPFLHHGIFPETLLAALYKHMRNPRASSSSDPALMQAIHEIYGTGGQLPLREIADKACFKLKKRRFTKGKLRRTRYLCCDVSNGRWYLISGSALVQGC